MVFVFYLSRSSLNRLPSVRYTSCTPAGSFSVVMLSTAVRNTENYVGARTQPSFPPVRTLKDFVDYQLLKAESCMWSWSRRMMMISFWGHHYFSRIFYSGCRLMKSNAFVRSKNVMQSGLCSSRLFSWICPAVNAVYVVPPEDFWRMASVISGRQLRTSLARMLPVEESKQFLCSYCSSIHHTFRRWSRSVHS